MTHSRIQYLAQKVEKSKKRLEKYRTCRLITGLMDLAFILLIAINFKTSFLMPFFLITSALFICFVKLTKNWSHFINRLVAYQRFHQLLKDKKENNFENQNPPPVPENFTFDLDNFSKDLHLLGKTSVFNLFNFSITPWGYKRLLNELISPQKKTVIEIKEIYKNTKFLGQSAKIIKRLQSLDLNQENQNIFYSFKNIFKAPLIDNNLKKYFVIICFLSSLNLLYILTFLLGKTPINPIPFMFLFLIINLTFSKKIKNPFKKALEFEQPLLNLKPITREIETNANAQQIKTFFPSLSTPLSKQFNTLEIYLSFLNAQSHPLLYLFVQSLVPWDFFFGHLLENWRKKVKLQLLAFENEFTKFEVLMCFVCTSWIKTTCQPNFSESAKWSIKQTYHPLLNESIAIKNDFAFEGFHIAMLTGSNMAGKSTFMRTIALNQHLTLLGAPIFANEFHTIPAPVVSCLHIKDAIEHGYSTFYFEVRKIKEIINDAKSGKHFFYFIDEIFRGTNNRERLIGSQSVLRELLNYNNAKGIISTHDLELAQSEEGHPGVSNFHFSDNFTNNTLTFPYKILPGLSQTTNALKIMQLEGLPVKK